MKIQVAGISHTGNVREANEDHFSIGPVVGQKDPLQMSVDTDAADFATKGLLAAVADGMGGYSGGKFASRTMLESLTKAFYAKPLPKMNRIDARDFVHSCLRTACETVVTRQQRSRELAEGGTTIAGMALFHPDIAVVFHVGDSRVLRVSGRFLRMLTVDHTPVGPDAAAGTVVDEDELAPEQRILLRSIGAEGTNDPEVNHEVCWAPGDRFILCSDGLHGIGKSLSMHEVRSAAQEALDPPALANRLVTDALGRGGNDNITAVVVQVQ